MGVMMRVGVLIGGIFLVVMAASVSIFKDKSAKVYWVSSFDRQNRQGFYFMLFDNKHPEPRLIRESTVDVALRHWWSADGEWFFYTRLDRATESSALWRVRPTGGTPKQIHHNIAPYDYYPKGITSPDGNMMVLRMFEVDGDSALVLTDANGDHPRRLVSFAESIVSNFWSPDSKWVYFVTQGQRAVDATTYRVNVQGGEAQLVYDGLIENPVWSPDRGWMLFVERSRGVSYIQKITVDGSIVTELLAGDGYYHYLQGWLANDWVIFEARLDETQPYRMRSDGTELAPLLDTFGVVISWSEDGTTAFIGWDGEAGDCVLFQVYIARLDQICLEFATNTYRLFWRDNNEISATFAAWPAYKSPGPFQTVVYVADRDGSNIHDVFEIFYGDIEWHYTPMPDHEWQIIWLPSTDDKEQWRVRRRDGHKVALPSGYDPLASPLLDLEETPVDVIGYGIVGIFAAVGMMGLRLRRAA